MKKLNVKTNPFGNKSFELVDAPQQKIVEWKDFEVLLEKKEHKIIALENNFLSRKYFEEFFKDNKYMIFNLAFGLKNASYSNNLINEDLVEEVIVLHDKRLNYSNFTVDIYQELTSEQLDEIIEFCDLQETTDCERETTVIDYQGNEGNYTIRVICEDEQPVKIIIGPLFNELLRFARKNLHLTQTEVAARIGVELQSYQRYEYGSRIPDGETMIKLVRLLNLNMLEVEKSL